MTEDRKDLEQMIRQFQEIQPSQQQLRQWDAAFRRPPRRDLPQKWKVAGALAAGLVLGFIAANIYQSNQAQDFENQFLATYTRVTINGL